MNYLKEGNKDSSMRLGWLIAIIMSAVLLGCTSVYILIMAIKCDGGIDWTGMGIFVLGVLGGLTGMGFAKAQQKKFEKGGSDDSIN